MARDTDIFAPGDLPAALGLLTRLPVPVDGARAAARGARAAWAWPLAGLAVAALAVAAGGAGLGLGLPPALAAAVVLAVQVAVTGAMHEDGLADSADGLWGGWDRDRRLAIMKDSRTGAYGVIALVLTLIARWAAVAALMAAPGWGWGLLAVAATSRASMTALSGALPSARPGGLSGQVGRPPVATVWAALGIALVVALLATGAAALALAFWTALVLAGWAAVARAKIGGQTGDILGAGQQLAEVAGLCVLVAALG